MVSHCWLTSPTGEWLLTNEQYGLLWLAVKLHQGHSRYSKWNYTFQKAHVCLTCIPTMVETLQVHHFSLLHNLLYGQALACHKAPHCRHNYSLLNLSLYSVPVVAPKHYKRKLSCSWMHPELLLGGQMGMFLFHALPFSLWFVTVDPCFISRDDPFQELVTSSSSVIQKLFADVRTFLFVQLCDSL